MAEGKSTDPRVLKLTWRALRSVFSLSTRDKPLNLERYSSCSDHTDKFYSSFCLATQMLCDTKLFGNTGVTVVNERSRLFEHSLDTTSSPSYRMNFPLVRGL